MGGRACAPLPPSSPQSLPLRQALTTGCMSARPGLRHDYEVAEAHAQACGTHANRLLFAWMPLPTGHHAGLATKMCVGLIMHVTIYSQLVCASYHHATGPFTKRSMCFHMHAGPFTKRSMCFHMHAGPFTKRSMCFHIHAGPFTKRCVFTCMPARLQQASVCIMQAHLQSIKVIHVFCICVQARLQSAVCVQGQVPRCAPHGPHGHRHPACADRCESAAAHPTLHHLQAELQPAQPMVMQMGGGRCFILMGVWGAACSHAGAWGEW